MEKIAQPQENHQFQLPKELQYLIEAERVSNCFRILLETEKAMMMDYSSDNRFSAPELIRKPNLCGYAAAAITEGLRKRSLNSRMVYGHGKKEGKTVYHYWTEVVMADGKKNEVDGTYEQFNPDAKGKILVYPQSDLSTYNLKEFTAGEQSTFEGDTPTAIYLNDNNGMLPIRDGIRNPKVLALYEDLVKNFS
jgi:hypothetical protein